MKSVPSISSQIDENKIFKIINKNFSKLAPSYYKLISNWFIRAYHVFEDIDKYLIVVYLINKDFVFFRRHAIVIDFETFFREKTLEIEKINISDISKDLQIPKESVRRKVYELEKKGVIKKFKKKIFIDRTVISKYFPANNRITTLNEVSSLLYEFNKLLKEENEISKTFEIHQITSSLKENYTFCWYQFNKFLFIFTNRWRAEVKDLETFCIGFLVMLNAADNKNFRVKDLNLKTFQKLAMSADKTGLNAMSISEITGIPRPTVVRKVKYLINNDYLAINEKKLISVNIRGLAFKRSTNLQDKNMLSLSNFIYRVFNKIKVINSN
ncbi:MarR family transcriptional regulator [Pelagibacterales bacterium SAG-MED30]|nr:MarR family transcriptional regulator [Pelagibacterales bacterium SAG-MED30]